MNNLVASKASPKSGGQTDQHRVGGESEFHCQRREAIRRDISRRLRRVCEQLSDDEFSQLVDEMTERQLKGEFRSHFFLS